MDNTTSPSAFVRTTLAAALLGAAVIHFAMVPQHMTEWAPEGIAFIVSGWVQVALAIGVVIRPKRWMLAATIAASVMFIAAWAITRIWGAPFGPNSGFAQPSSYVDLACVILESAAVIVAVAALWRPKFATNWRTEGIVFASIIPVAVLVLATTAVASPSASHHAHGGNACPKGQKPNPELVASDGHAHDPSACVPDIDDKGLSLLTNGHHHEIRNDPLDPATQAEVDRQLAITREVAAQFPTLADAAAAGYRRAGGYSPGLGVHYTHSGIAELNPAGTMTDETLRHPQSLIYAGTEPNSPIAGFMYYSMSKIEPTGFPGTNDTWHYHSNVCVKFSAAGTDAPFGADRGDVTKEMCSAVGGVMLNTTQWMVHVWSVPGWENDAGGVFAEVNPKLGCSDGTYYRVSNEELVSMPINICQSGAPGDPTSSEYSQNS
ncbi:unannotated protein [freshwater metagenome]|uniref:Unannotated protein n=1 Tax=freshwater metagenome TaxID=449393 RepID=A0A6J6H4N7_9ZZZZ|nr:hypothetical protein [Actinomycetota bacterium]